jgi:CheY-like chemotaxis protein
MATRVLLADDHTIVRQGLRILLQREGFEVVGEAANGAEAVRLATETTPDVVVLDYGMPLMNGLTAAREIMAVCPRAKLISRRRERCTARGRAPPERQGLRQEPGADGSGATFRSTRQHDVLGPPVSRTVSGTAKSELPRPLTPRERRGLVAAGKTRRKSPSCSGSA